MLKLKEIEIKLGPKWCWRSQNGQMLHVKCCVIGCNAEKWYTGKEYDYSLFPELKDDHRIYVVDCCDCCNCGDW